MRFRRRGPDGPEEAPEAVAPEEETAAGPEAADPRSRGPWDASEVSLADDDPTKIDLGGLILTGRPTLEVQLQVDEASGEVVAVLLAGEDGAAELRAFAAPRHGDIWDDVRRSISAEVTQRGGTVDHQEGPWGPELRVVLPVTMPDGRSGSQPSRVLGIRGPRWLLRATLFGRPAVEPAEDGEVESAVRDVIVVRGTEPLPPGDPIPLKVPDNLTPVEPEE